MDYELLDEFELIIRDRSEVLKNLHEIFVSMDEYTNGRVSMQMYDALAKASMPISDAILDIEAELGVMPDQLLVLLEDLETLTTEGKALQSAVAEMLADNLGDQDLANTIADSLFTQTLNFEEILNNL
jgi:hypothetical protein